MNNNVSCAAPLSSSTRLKAAQLQATSSFGAPKKSKQECYQATGSFLKSDPCCGYLLRLGRLSSKVDVECLMMRQIISHTHTHIRARNTLHLSNSISSSSSSKLHLERRLLRQIHYHFGASTSSTN